MKQGPSNHIPNFISQPSQAFDSLLLMFVAAIKNMKESFITIGSGEVDPNLLNREFLKNSRVALSDVEVEEPVEAASIPGVFSLVVFKLNERKKRSTPQNLIKITIQVLKQASTLLPNEDPFLEY